MLPRKAEFTKAELGPWGGDPCTPPQVWAVENPSASTGSGSLRVCCVPEVPLIVCAPNSCQVRSSLVSFYKRIYIFFFFWHREAEELILSHTAREWQIGSQVCPFWFAEISEGLLPCAQELSKPLFLTKYSS